MRYDEMFRSILNQPEVVLLDRNVFSSQSLDKWVQSPAFRLAQDASCLPSISKQEILDCIGDEKDAHPIWIEWYNAIPGEAFGRWLPADANAQTQLRRIEFPEHSGLLAAAIKSVTTVYPIYKSIPANVKRDMIEDMDYRLQSFLYRREEFVLERICRAAAKKIEQDDSSVQERVALWLLAVFRSNPFYCAYPESVRDVLQIDPQDIPERCGDDTFVQASKFFSKHSNTLSIMLVDIARQQMMNNFCPSAEARKELQRNGIAWLHRISRDEQIRSLQFARDIAWVAKEWYMSNMEDMPEALEFWRTLPASHTKALLGVGIQRLLQKEDLPDLFDAINADHRDWWQDQTWRLLGHGEGIWHKETIEFIMSRKENHAAFAARMIHELGYYNLSRQIMSGKTGEKDVWTIPMERIKEWWNDLMNLLTGTERKELRQSIEWVEKWINCNGVNKQ